MWIIGPRCWLESLRGMELRVLNRWWTITSLQTMRWFPGVSKRRNILKVQLGKFGCQLLQRCCSKKCLVRLGRRLSSRLFITFELIPCLQLNKTFQHRLRIAVGWPMEPNMGLLFRIRRSSVGRSALRFNRIWLCSLFLRLKFE